MTSDKPPIDRKPRCFVIMPISDAHGYDNGHFARVYEHLIKPAITQAGYEPVRADDTIKTDYIVIDIIKQILDSEVALCDFSARNPNVMYELGIRHAYNRPVALIKDRRTDKIFDIQGLRYTEYDDTLRIDSVLKDITKIANSLKDTANSGPESVNSVLQLAGIRAAELPAGQPISADTNVILNALSGLDSRLASIEGTRKTERYFTFRDDSVVFRDASEARLGGEIFDDWEEPIGELVDMHPAENRIFVRTKSGKVISFNAFSIRSKGITALPL